MTTSAFSGAQFALDNGTARAEVGAVAAVLRSLSVGGIRLTENVPLDTITPQGCGMVLAPWPNRVRDGRWLLDGEPQQLDITEPPYKNASHGLLRNTAYRIVEQSADAVTLGAHIAPQHGWPFALDTTVRYALQHDGLTVTHGVHNLSGRVAPYAVGAHPYFRIGEWPIEDLTVTVDRPQWLETDERFLPVAIHSVEGTDRDLRSPRRVGDLDLNSAYGDDQARAAGELAALAAPDGSRLSLWADEDFGWVQTFMPRNFPRPAELGGTGLAIALEPMTAAPDALNSSRGLIWLQPGTSSQRSWGVRFTPAP